MQNLIGYQIHDPISQSEGEIKKTVSSSDPDFIGVGVRITKPALTSNHRKDDYVIWRVRL